MTPSLVWTSCLPVSRVNLWLDSRLAGSPIWVTVDLMAGLPGLVFCKFAYFASDEVTQIGDPACFLVGDFRVVGGVINAQIQTKNKSSKLQCKSTKYKSTKSTNKISDKIFTIRFYQKNLEIPLILWMFWVVLTVAMSTLFFNKTSSCVGVHLD